MRVIHFLDLTLPTLAENLALDEGLLLMAEEGGPEMLRLWEWPTPAVVLGAAGRVGEEVREDLCRNDGVPINRRSSGGGAVLLGSGCLCFSLVLSYERAAELREIRPSYCCILRRICDGLNSIAPGIEPAGTSDLAIAGRKISGNSQQRKRHHLLHHGTLLYAFALATIERYLPLPPRQPDYRQARSHRAFLVNLSTTRTALAENLRQAWQATAEPASWPENITRRLVEDKYSRHEWIYRRA